MKSFLSLWILAIYCVVVVSCSKDPEPDAPETQPPAAPVALAAGSISPTAFEAKWNAVVGVTTYQLDLSTDNFATFVTGFSNKEIKALSQLITGLTPNTTYKYRLRATNANGTSTNSNEITATTLEDDDEEEPEGEIVADLDGEDFIADEITVTDTNIGLELNMTSGDNDITLRLSDRVAGTYTIQNTAPAGRTAEDKTAVASWLASGETFFGESGSVTVTLSEGKVSMEFSADAKNEDGKPSKITKGKVTNLPIKQPGGTNCVLASYSEEDDDYTINFGYDKQGRLIQFKADETLYNYFWSKTQVTKLVFLDEEGKNEESWTYTGNKVTKITGVHVDAGNNQTSSYTITYTYTGDKLTKAVRSQTNESGTDIFTNDITYSGDNVATDVFTYNEDSQTHSYSQYDTKNNFWSLLVKAVNNPQPVGFYEQINGEYLSKNNPGKIEGSSVSRELYEYGGYTASGYPTTLTYRYQNDEQEEEDTYTATMTYNGCGN